MAKSFTLPVGLLEEGVLRTQVEINIPTARTLKRVRDALLGEKGRLNPEVYMVALRESVASLEGGPVTDARLHALAWVDAEFIYYQAARLEFDEPDPEIPIVCSSCDRFIKVRFPFNSVRIVDLSDPECKSAFANSTRTISFALGEPITTLDLAKTPVSAGSIGLLTVKQQLDLQRKGTKIGTAMLESIFGAIAELGGRPRGSFALADIEGMLSSDIKKIERTYNANIPGVFPPTDITCPSCEKPLSFTTIDWVTDFLAGHRA